MDKDHDLVAQAIDAVRDAADLQQALDALTRLLRPRFGLWYASVCSHPTDAPSVSVLASWSLAESMFDAGAEVSSTISRTVETVLSTLREGRGASFAVGGDPGSLVDHLLQGQGVACVLTLPIYCDDHDLLILVLGASDKDAFDDAGKGFFTALSKGIREEVLRLAPAANG